MVANITKVDLGGRRLVLMDEAAYEDLRRRAGLPAEIPDEGAALPTPAADGSVPAVAYARASIARSIRRDRLAAGLSQAELARRAGVRQETVSRLESGRHTITPRVFDRIDKVLRQSQLAPGKKARR